MKERCKPDSADMLLEQIAHWLARAMTMCHTEVNGIKIAFDIRGSGPPLIMRYRLNSRAWPLASRCSIGPSPPVS